MEIVDFAALKGKDDLRAALNGQLEEALRKERIAPDQAETVRQEMKQIEDFMRSYLGKKILAGAKTLREKPFQLRMGQGDGMALVQGVIDLMIEDGDGMILVDYKTDRSGLDAQSVRQKHGQQVKLYRMAAEGTEGEVSFTEDAGADRELAVTATIENGKIAQSSFVLTDTMEYEEDLEFPELAVPGKED